MKKKIDANSLVLYAIYIQILYAFLPIIRALPDIIRIGFRITPLVLVFFALVCKNHPKLWWYYLLICLFAVFIAISRSMVYANGIVDSIPVNILNSILYWSCMVEGVYVIQFFDSYAVRKMLRKALLLIALSSLTSIIRAIISPGAIRQTTSMLTEEFNYYIYNVGAYSYVYALVFMLSILFFLIRFYDVNGRIVSKSLMILITLEIMVNIILSQFMTAVAVASVSFLAIGRSKKMKRFFTWLVIIVIAVFIFIEPIALLINNVAKLVQNWGMTDLHDRLNGIYLLLIVGNARGDVGARLYLYQISLNHFKNNPIFGLIGENGFKRTIHHSVSSMLNTTSFSSIMAVGQHGDIIDLLGGGGLIAFIPFTLIIILFWKKITKYVINLDASLKYIIVCYIQFIIYGIFDHSFSCIDVALVVFVLVSSIAKLQETHRAQL